MLLGNIKGLWLLFFAFYLGQGCHHLVASTTIRLSRVYCFALSDPFKFYIKSIAYEILNLKISLVSLSGLEDLDDL